MSVPLRPSSSPSTVARAPRLRSLLRTRPILCLLLLSPGIPEYLSSSSSMSLLVLNPIVFFLFLGLNLALYGPGVLLVREAMVRWRKGWASVLTLGAAYGIYEEGISLNTLFNPQAGPVGALGQYGHWIGINWVWVPGVLLIHMVFSIALPILLLSLALPETNGRSLVSHRGLATAFVVIAADGAVLWMIVRYWTGVPIIAGAFLIIGLLIAIAYRMPADLLRPASERPQRSPLLFGVLGALFFPTMLLVEFPGLAVGAPPVVVILSLLILESLYLLLVTRYIGGSANQRHLVALSAGLLAPIGVFGVLAELPLPVVLLADAAAFLFLRFLWRRYQREPTIPPMDQSRLASQSGGAGPDRTG